MSVLPAILLYGVSYGMILFLISVGLSVTMGVMRVTNLAHGGFALIGGALTHVLVARWGWPFWPGALAAVAGTALIAWPLERLVYRRVYALGELEQVLATIGLAFLMIATVNVALGSDILSIPLPRWMGETVSWGTLTLPVHRLVVIAAGAALGLGLWLLIARSRFGIRLRAAVDNAGAASALGIDTGRVYTLTFMLGAALAAVGGILGAELLPIEAYYPLRYLVLFLIVVAVGGLGSVTGSFVASLTLGILDTAARFLVPEWGTIFFLAAMMAILAIRPQGLLGRTG